MASKLEVELQTRIENDDSYRRELQLVFRNLRGQAISNLEYFQDAKGASYERMFSAFGRLYEHLDSGIEPGVEYLLSVVHKFDFSPAVPANGYRSIVKVVHRCCLHILQLTRHISVNRESFLFRSGHYSRELDAYVTTLGQIRAILYYLQKLVSYCNDGSLFPNQDKLSAEEYAIAELLMMEVEQLNQEAFYGRCLGFQYCESMVRPLNTVILAMASFADAYGQNSTVMKFVSSALGGGKYILDPESRAQQVVTATRSADKCFTKAFWSLVENDLFRQLPLFVCPPVALSKVIRLTPDSFEIPLVDGSDTARITPPCAHIGPAPVHTRLISYRLRQGQERWKSNPGARDGKGSGSDLPRLQVAPPSPCLLLHCHGGGFVAQSSASHETYLRHWAKDLDVPIFSVDYSLAPELPFPRQLEEIFFAYCWALKNPHLLGWTGETVCLVGDSAGGNLCIATAMRIASYGIRRPDGLLSIYGVFNVCYVPSPSRILSLMDPLLPLGVVSHCLAAYAGMTGDGAATFPPTSPVSSGSQTSGVASPDTCDTASPETTSPGATSPGVTSLSSASPGTNSPKKSNDTEVNESGDAKGLTSPQVSPLSVGTDPSVHHSRQLSTSSRDSGFLDVTSHHGDCVQDGNNTEVVNEVAVGPKNNEGNHSRTLSAGSIPEEGEEGVDDFPAITSQETSQELMSHLACQMKSGADNLDRSVPQRSGLDLNFQNLRRRQHNVGMTKSPSSPVLHSSGGATVCHAGGSMQASTPGATHSPLGALGSPPVYAQIRHFAQSPVATFRHLPIAKNPYMSPILARDDQLRGLCPVQLIACHLDPMLDDSVMLARRLKVLGREVGLDVIDLLPHGFLNFSLVSREAKHASDLCARRLRQLLGITQREMDEYEILDPPDFQTNDSEANDDIAELSTDVTS